MKSPGRPHVTWVKQLDDDVGLFTDHLWDLTAVHSEWATL